MICPETDGEKMRSIDTSIIKEAVCDLFISANYKLPDDITEKIKTATHKEKNETANSILSKLIENAEVAEKINVPVCQDTGMAVVFIEIGQEVSFCGELLEDAVNDGVRAAYETGYMRKSVVSDPLFERKNADIKTKPLIPILLNASTIPTNK